MKPRAKQPVQVFPQDVAAALTGLPVSMQMRTHSGTLLAAAQGETWQRRVKNMVPVLSALLRLSPNTILNRPHAIIVSNRLRLPTRFRCGSCPV